MGKSGWAEEQIAYLIDNFPHKLTQEVADYLGKSYSSVTNKTFELGLKKSEEFRKLRLEIDTKRLLTSGVSYRFKKGQIPHNLGKPMSEETKNKVLPTCFKKGQLPPNTKPIGYERICKDGYVEVKTEKGFCLKHRHIWSNTFGEIPKGANVQFIDGNRHNLSLDNLELVVKSENMRRNTIHNLPEELKELIRLRVKILKTIKKRKDEE